MELKLAFLGAQTKSLDPERRVSPEQSPKLLHQQRIRLEGHDCSAGVIQANGVDRLTTIAAYVDQDLARFWPEPGEQLEVRIERPTP